MFKKVMIVAALFAAPTLSIAQGSAEFERLKAELFQKLDEVLYDTPETRARARYDTISLTELRDIAQDFDTVTCGQLTALADADELGVVNERALAYQAVAQIFLFSVDVANGKDGRIWEDAETFCQQNPQARFTDIAAR